jgi:dipeptidyl aminopeptidase/acylaminoacyl peptidase
VRAINSWRYTLHILPECLVKKTTKIGAVAGVATLLWAGAVAAIAANQRKLVFNPETAPEVDKPRSSGHKTRPVVLRGADGTRLSGWLLTPEVAGPHPAVLYFGGRSEEVSWVVRDAGRMFPGMAVLAMNYRGYGQSHGEPGEAALVSDGGLLFDWLASRAQVDPARIALVGRSLGSGVAVQVARARPASALVLVTPYDSILALAQKKFRAVPVGRVLRHRFDSLEHAPNLATPTLVLRSATDTIVPHAHTDRLVARLPGLVRDETVPDSDHCTIPYLADTQERIARFLAERFTAPARAA